MSDDLSNARVTIALAGQTLKLNSLPLVGLHVAVQGTGCDAPTKKSSKDSQIQGGKATANLLTGLLPDKVFARTTSKATENLLTDQLGSTIGLAGSTGSVETTYTYDPFGTTTSEGTASENTTQYAGQENEGNGIYYDRARYYSPAAARFLSQDPTGQEGSGPNLYLYTGDSPTNATDPYGTNLQAPERVHLPEERNGGGVGFGPGPGSGSCAGHGGGSKGSGLSGGGDWAQKIGCGTEEGMEEDLEEERRHHCQPGEVIINHQCYSGPSERPEPPQNPPVEQGVEEEPPLLPFWPVPIPVPPLPVPE